MNCTCTIPDNISCTCKKMTNDPMEEFLKRMDLFSGSPLSSEVIQLLALVRIYREECPCSCYQEWRNPECNFCNAEQKALEIIK